MPDVDRPHPAWRILIPGGLLLLAFDALHADFYAWWTTNVHPLPGQGWMLAILVACVPIHIFEAGYAWRTARRIGLPPGGWALQSFVLGYPSTRLIRARARLQDAPGPAEGILGSTLPFKRAPLDFVLAMHARFGDVVRFRIMHQNWYLLCHPDDIHEVLVTNAAKFHKPAIARRLWSEFLGKGILTAEGEAWKAQHALIRPGFLPERIAAFAGVMVAHTRELVAECKEGERRDACADMTALTLSIVSKTLFDADVKKDAGRVGKAMNVLNELMLEHIYNPLPVPRWWPSAANRRKVQALDQIHAIVDGIIAERRASGEDRGDLLSMLVHARGDDGKGMPDAQLRDEAMTLFFAGHETTAHALTWTWYLLARHPEVQERAWREVDGVAGKRPLTAADLRSLPYLDCVVKEGMRFLPSVWSFMRETVEDVRIGGHPIEKGAFIFVSPYVLQHDARFFPDPETFDPDRFRADAPNPVPPRAFIPFSSGSRVCIGKAFAMMEMRLILGTLLQHTRACVPADYEPVLLPQLSLRPRGGLPIDVRFREA